MHYRIVILLCLMSLNGFAQTLTYKYVDSITYSQFTNNQGDSLIEFANAAWKENIDFYYLRMRVGVVYYNNKKFEKALPHFKKANEMNPADTIAQEYLYYSYLFSDRKKEADIFAEKLESFMKNKLHYKKRKIEAVSIGFGYAYTDNAIHGKSKPIAGKYNIYGAALYQGNLFYSNALIEHKISPKLKVMYGAWYYMTDNIGVVHVSEGINSKELKDSHYQLNIAGTYYYKDGWDVSLATSSYIQNASSYSATYNEIENKYDFYTTNKETFSNAVVIGLGKRMGKLYPIINAASSVFNGILNTQVEGTLMLYPFGNTNIYSSTSCAFQMDTADSRVVFFQKVGVRVSKKIWLEGNFSYGNHFNYVSKYASLTYNTIEPIHLISGFDFKVYLKHMEWNVGYRFQQLEGKYIYYTTPIDFKTQKYYYTNHLISTTLKWNF